MRIVKIVKLEYRLIIKYLHLKELRGKQIYEDMISVLHMRLSRMRSLCSTEKKFALMMTRELEKQFLCLHQKISVHDMILSDRRIRLKYIAEKLEILYERIHHIVHVHLEMTERFAKWIPKCLNAD